MSVTTKKKDYKLGELDFERLYSVKKKLFSNDNEDNEDIITNTCKKSNQEERVYNILMTCKGKGKKVELKDRVVSQEVRQNDVSFEENKQETVDLLTRKRKRQPDKWKRNIMKKKREAGEEYVNMKEETKPKKIVRTGCEVTCNYNCSTRLSNSKREELKTQFYSLSDDQKYKYYNEYTERKQTERKRTQRENSRRKYSFLYYFPNGKIKERVCKKFFCTTLDISVKRVYHFYKKKYARNANITPTPQKGKYVKKQTDPGKIEEVKQHIKSFPVQESHYCRATTKRQYLEPGLSITKMYSLYASLYKEPVKENIYRKVFNENFNLSFHRPKKDTCDICCEYKAISNPDENQQLKYKAHMIRKDEGDKERAIDRQINLKNTNTAVITFDLENIFSLPKANISCFYYTSKLTVYNLTGHCNIDNSATNAIWDETKNGRAGDDIASALIKILIRVVENLPSNITKIIIWSDSCVPQNKNSHMSMALLNFLQSEKASNVTEIEQKFSEPGHGNVQEVDCVHSVIERNLRHKEIYSPLGLMRELLKIQSKIKLQFLQMLDTDFHSFHDEAIKLGFGQIPYKKIKSIKYKKPEWNIVEYRTSFTATAIPTNIKKSKINILNEIVLKNPKNCLADKKIQDIRSVYKYMPIEDKNYMEALIKKVKAHNAEDMPTTSKNLINGNPKQTVTVKHENKSKQNKKKATNKAKKGKK